MKITGRMTLLTGLALAIAWAAAPAIAREPQYLLFQIFSGGPDPNTGIYTNARKRPDIESIADKIGNAVGPSHRGTDHYLGLAFGPIAMDQDEDEARSFIRDAFDVALDRNMAVALHLDDYMFWGNARGTNGRLLRENPDNVEWTDWNRSPAEGLRLGYGGNKSLPPQMCYESREIKEFVTHWARDIIGDEVRRQLQELKRQGKSDLFAGIIIGWESNLAYGYCSLTQRGYNADNPPRDFDYERERILQRHIARIAKALNDTGIDRNLIFSHIAPIPKKDFAKISGMQSREQIRKMHQSTVFRAFWTAFSDYANPGFSAYPAEGLFDDFYKALKEHGNPPWAMAEGTNVVLGHPHPQGAKDSPVNWETYLGMSFNHGARIVNIFGGFQGKKTGKFQRETESPEAIAAYQKFLRGEPLTEEAEALSAAASSDTSSPGTPSPGTPSPGTPPSGQAPGSSNILAGLPTELAERIGKLVQRIRSLQQSGDSNLGKVAPKMRALRGYVESADVERITELLDEIERELE